MVINKTKIARAALYVFMFSINYEMFNLVGNSGSLSVGRITGFLYLGVLLYQRIRLDIYPFKNLLYPLILFFTAITVSSAVNLNPFSLQIFDVSIVQNVVLFFLLLIHERNDSGVLEKSLYSFALGTVLLGMFYLAGVGVEYTVGRLSLFGDNENIVGLRMCISSIIIIYSVLIYGKKLSWRALFLILPIPVLLSVMLKTGSRVAFISFVLMAAVLLFLYLRVASYKKVIITLMFASIGLYLFKLSVVSNVLLMDRLYVAEQGDLAGRQDIWHTYLKYLWQSPILGYGFSGFNELGRKAFGAHTSPHNVIIEIMLYGGFIALIAYGWFLFKVFYYGYRRFLSEKKYLGLLLMIPYIGSVISAQVMITKLMWFILAFNCISLSHVRMREKIGP